MSFSWENLVDGLGDNLDTIGSVAMLIPGGQVVGGALLAIDKAIDKNSNVPAPLESAANIIDATTKARSVEGTIIGIDNQVVIDMLKSMANSTQNKVDDKLICIVEAYLLCNQK